MIGLSQLLVNIEQGHQLSTSLKELKNKLNDPQYEIVEEVYNAAYASIRTYATHYMYIIAAGSLFALYTQFLSMLIISEGKQIFAVVSSIICNVLTVLLD
ncbi:hypothetical protein FACS1894218_3970 [Bacilli bacterium]|nr:hypothetical protein FACS1894218_3970 [Bacilli bacterium]